jgi:tyrosine-specific transport protein
MTKFCKNNRELIRKACIWGSLIPAIVYIVWTIAILLVVANSDPKFFQLMLEGKATDVGQLIAVLCRAASSEKIHAIIWIVSVLSILTSIFGVGVALLDIFQNEWKIPKWKSVFWIVFAPAIVSMFVPNAFIRILNISGIILSIIAIIVPVTISWKMKKIGNLKCDLLLKNKIIMASVFLCGILIIGLGIIDLINS